MTNIASDADVPVNTLTLSLVSAPAGMSLDSNTGVLTWTPTEAQGPSTNTIRVKVSDDGSPSLSTTNSFTIVVTEVNSAPVAGPVADQRIAELSTLVVTIPATDADIPANSLTFSLASAPAGVSVNPNTGVLTWTPSEVQGPNTNMIVVRVTDSGTPALRGFVSFTVVVDEVNRPPLLASIADQVAFARIPRPTRTYQPISSLLVWIRARPRGQSSIRPAAYSPGRRPAVRRRVQIW